MFANDKTSIITFANSALGVCPLTKDKELLNKNAKFYSSGGTNANAAVSMALRQFVGVSGNKSIILLSDGDVNVSNSNLESAKNNNIKIHAVALGQGANSSALKKCAEKTDGEFFVIKTAAELESIYDKLSADNQLIFRNMPDTDGDGVPDDIEISGIPMPNGKMVFTDPTDPYTDNDELSDGDEVGKMRRASYFPSNVPDYAVTYKFSFDVTSDPTLEDSDNDGLLDGVNGSGDKDHIKDPCPLEYNHFINLGSGEYMADLISRFENSDYCKNVYTYDPLSDSDEEPPKEYYDTIVDLMMADVNSSVFHELIWDEYWDDFCEFFNYCILRGSTLNPEKHYFRNKLNRAPLTLKEMLCFSEKWVLCNIYESLYHMFGKDGEYNLKFISNCGKYEAVYDKNGNLLTKDNDPINMGTYNYANFKKEADLHRDWDVLPYYIYNNVEGQGMPSILPIEGLVKPQASPKAVLYRCDFEQLWNANYNNDDRLTQYDQIFNKHFE